MRKWLRRLLWVGAAVVLAPLAGGLFIISPFLTYPVIELRIGRVKPKPPEIAATFRAGIAVRDITPPPGIPKFGYSAWARNADGFRTRLKARAFCLQAAGEAPLVILQADLGASSLVLHHRVAGQLASQTDVPPHRLALFVTHTHSGPGQYFESDFYNRMGSNAPGFDPEVFEFLADRLGDAALAACAARRPARLAVGQRAVWGLTRNRSLGAWLRNPQVTDRRATPERTFEAVNPVMTMIRVDIADAGGTFVPAGALTSFSIHGTGIPFRRAPYHADVWFWFARELELAVARDASVPDFVHATFLGTHGDNNPAWIEGLRGDLDTRRIGQGLGANAAVLFTSLGGALTSEVRIAAGFRELDLLALPAAERAPLCERAVIGAATVAGANGDEVFPVSYLPLIADGWPKARSSDCHAEKHWMLSSLQSLGLEPSRFPTRLPLQVIRLNDLSLVALPFEMTLEAGRRVSAAVAARAGGDPSKVVVVSHANAYFAYATTREEYGAQSYEGGQTIYGPGTTEFLARESARLALDLADYGEVADLPAAWRFRLASRRFWPAAESVTGARKLLVAPTFTAGDRSTEPHWSLEVLDVAPGAITLHEPLLTVETETAAGWQPFVDDESGDLQIALLGRASGGMARYALRWFHPPPAAGRRYRMAVAARAGLPAWVSPVFPASTVP